MSGIIIHAELVVFHYDKMTNWSADAQWLNCVVWSYLHSKAVKTDLCKEVFTVFDKFREILHLNDDDDDMYSVIFYYSVLWRGTTE